MKICEGLKDQKVWSSEKAAWGSTSKAPLPAQKHLWSLRSYPAAPVR